MKKIITITNISPFSQNRGVSAIAMATISIIRRYFPNHQLILTGFQLSENYSASLYNLKYKNDKKIKIVREGKNLYDYAIKLIVRLYLSVISNIMKKLNIHTTKIYIDRLLKIYLESDVIISLNWGDDFTDIYGIARSIRWMHEYLTRALINDKPVIFFPQTIGPFNNPITRFFAKYILNRTRIIMVREKISEKYIKKIGIDNQKIFLVPDPAFILEPIGSEYAKKILENEGVLNIKEIIGISLRDLLTPNCVDKKIFKKYINLMVKIIDYIIKNYNVTVILVPHHGIENKSNIQDVNITQKILKKVKNKDKVHFINKKEYAVEEIKGIIGRCSLFIGAYMHANISALSVCVPTIGLSYSQKFPGIFEVVGQEKYVCNLKYLTFKELVSKVEKAWNNREKIKKELELRMIKVKKQVMFAGELVKKILEEQEFKQF